MKKVSGFDYLWCALYACAGFAFELLLVQIEKMMGLSVGELTTAQKIIHFIVIWRNFVKYILFISFCCHLLNC